MAKNYAIQIEAVLRPVLAPDERLLATASLLKDPGSTEDVSLSDELKNLLDPTILIGGSHPGNLLQRAAFGRALLGGPESLAGRLHAAVDAVTTPTLAVTDGNLVIADVELIHLSQGNWLRRWLGATKQVARVIHTVPRDAIVGAIMAPAGLLRRGRFLVVLADGSACALVGAPRSLSRQAVEAIGPPRSMPATHGEE